MNQKPTVMGWACCMWVKPGIRTSVPASALSRITFIRSTNALSISRISRRRSIVVSSRLWSFRLLAV